jgi:hypothetical protein
MSQQKSEMGWTTHSREIDVHSEEEDQKALKVARNGQNNIKESMQRDVAQEEAFFGAQIRNRFDAGSLAEMLSFKKSYQKHLREFAVMKERLDKID